MNTQKIKLLPGLLLLLLAVPTPSLAYFINHADATKITSNTALYTVTYKFGFLNRETYVPIIATRSLGGDVTGLKVGYDIVDSNVQVASEGKTSALVLTNDPDVKIIDGKYYIPRGKAAEFTLVTLLTLSPEEQAAATKNRSLLLTKLPITMVDGDVTITARLKATDLQKYRTRAISF